MFSVLNQINPWGNQPNIHPDIESVLPIQANLDLKLLSQRLENLVQLLSANKIIDSLLLESIKSTQLFIKITQKILDGSMEHKIHLLYLSAFAHLIQSIDLIKIQQIPHLFSSIIQILTYFSGFNSPFDEIEKASFNSICVIAASLLQFPELVLATPQLVPSMENGSKYLLPQKILFDFFPVIQCSSCEYCYFIECISLVFSCKELEDYYLSFVPFCSNWIKLFGNFFPKLESFSENQFSIQTLNFLYAYLDPVCFEKDIFPLVMQNPSYLLFLSEYLVNHRYFNHFQSLLLIFQDSHPTHIPHQLVCNIIQGIYHCAWILPSLENDSQIDDFVDFIKNPNGSLLKNESCLARYRDHFSSMFDDLFEENDSLFQTNPENTVDFETFKKSLPVLEDPLPSDSNDLNDETSAESHVSVTPTDNLASNLKIKSPMQSFPTQPSVHNAPTSSIDSVDPKFKTVASPFHHTTKSKSHKPTDLPPITGTIIKIAGAFSTFFSEQKPIRDLPLQQAQHQTQLNLSQMWISYLTESIHRVSQWKENSLIQNSQKKYLTESFITICINSLFNYDFFSSSLQSNLSFSSVLSILATCPFSCIQDQLFPDKFQDSPLIHFFSTITKDIHKKKSENPGIFVPLLFAHKQLMIHPQADLSALLHLESKYNAKKSDFANCILISEISKEIGSCAEAIRTIF